MKPPHKDWALARTRDRGFKMAKRIKRGQISHAEAQRYAEHMQAAERVTYGFNLDLLVLGITKYEDGAPFGYCAFRCMECGGTLMRTVEEVPTDDSMVSCKACGCEHGSLGRVKALQSFLVRDELEFGDGENYRPSPKALALLDAATTAKMKAEGSWPD